MKKSSAIMMTGVLGILSLVFIDSITGIPDGALLFRRERCINCHCFKGQGGGIGPELTDVAKKRNDDWLRDQIKNPKLHSPYPRMPNHEHLSRKEVKALLRYLKS